MALLRTIIISLLLLALVVPSSAQIINPNPISEPSFETVAGWAYAEVDGSAKFSGGTSGSYATNGSLSYAFSWSGGSSPLNNYAQISRSVNLTGIYKITFDKTCTPGAWFTGGGFEQFNCSVLVDSTTITSGQDLTSLALTGSHTLKVAMHVTQTGSMPIGEPVYAYFDNFVAYNITPAIPVMTQHLNYFNSSSTTVTWAAVSDAAWDTINYTVRVGTSPGASDVLSYTDLDTTSNSFTMTPENNYYYSVRACGTYACSDWATEKNFNFAVITPYTPVNGSSTTKSYPPIAGTVDFTWSEIGGGLNYNLLVAEDINFNIVAVDTTTSYNYSSQSLKSGLYWWKVQYYNSTSGQFYNWSVVSNFTLSNTYPSGSGSRIYGIVYKTLDGVYTPVSGVNVRLWNNYSTFSSTKATGSNGYFEFTGLTSNTTYFLQGVKSDEYDDSKIDIITTNSSGIEANIEMFDCTIAYNCFEGQQYVTYTVTSSFGARYPGVSVEVFKGTEVIPTLSGATGDGGSVTFHLIKDQQYRITFINSTINLSVVWIGTPSLLSYPVLWDPTYPGYSSVNITGNVSNYTIEYTPATWSLQNLTGPYLTSSLGIGPMGQGIIMGIVGWLLISVGGVFAVLSSYIIFALLGILQWQMAALIAMTALSLFVLLGGIGQSW